MSERIAVVIPTYGRDDLVATAAAPFTPTPSDLRVVVVDDGSGRSGRLRDAAPHASVLELPENRGFGAAINEGFRDSSAQYLVALNDDARIESGDLQTLCEFLEAHPDAAAVAPALLDTEGAPSSVAFRFPRPIWRKLRARHRGSRTSWPAAPVLGEAPLRADYLKGACVLFRRRALAEVGLFDEQFWMFAEEIDLFRRLDAAGWQAWVVPEAQAVHTGGASTRNHPDRSQASRYRVHSYRSICRYYAKHHSVAARSWLRIEAGLRVGARLLGELARLAVGRGDPWWIREHGRCLRVLLVPHPSRPREGRLAPEKPASDPAGA